MFHSYRVLEMTKSRIIKKKFNAFAFVDNLRRSWSSNETIIRQQHQQYAEVQQNFLVIASFNHLQDWVVGKARTLLAKLAAMLNSQLSNIISMSKILVQFSAELRTSRCRMDTLLQAIALTSQHISNLIVINDLQLQINACYARFYKWENQLRDLLCDESC